ncbi:hypothetical protein CFP56_012972 [Quercus suber]|uniref:Uncharacterized protein n=1 Tax=Quercus suber TaxID=58331 RepID=A0AAW0KWS6_QUESU
MNSVTQMLEGVVKCSFHLARLCLIGQRFAKQTTDHTQRAKLATKHWTERLEDTSVPKLSKGYCHFQLKVTFGKDSKIHKGCIKVLESTLIIPGSSSGLG